VTTLKARRKPARRRPTSVKAARRDLSGNGLNEGTPIYAQLILHFRHQIETGRWLEGQNIPTLLDLAAEFGVARATIRQALGFLEREGLISSRRGRGTVVIGRPSNDLWFSVPAAWGPLDAMRDQLTAEILEFDPDGRLPDAPIHIRGTLAAGYGLVRRLVKREGVPYLIGATYIDRRIVEEIGADEVYKAQGYQTVEQSRLFRGATADQSVTVDVADAEIAYLLGITLNAPIVVVERWVLDPAGTLISYSEGRYRSDFVRIERRLI
jgi:GntR family transcriptional regulator